MERKKIEVCGAMVLWTMAKESDALAVEYAFANAGLGEFTPKRRSDQECLRAALLALKAKGQILQPLKNRKKHGLELVNVERGEVCNHYVPDFNARVENGRVYTGYGAADTAAIQAEFDHQQAIFTPGCLSAALVNVIRSRCCGVSYGRSAGGVYWVPVEKLRPLERLAPDLEKAATVGETSIVINEVGLTERTARELLKSLTEEVKAQAADILEAARNGLSKQALAKRQDQVMALKATVEAYRPLLADSLAALDRVTDTVHQVIAQITLANVAQNASAWAVSA